MAIEIRQDRWCDIHLQEKDERVVGAEYLITVARPSGKVVPQAVDLCDDCAAVIGSLEELLATYGRKAMASSPKLQSKVAAAVKAAPGSEPMLTEDVLTCPIEGCEYVGPSWRSLNAHTQRTHDRMLLQIEGKIGDDLSCLRCDPPRAFERRAAVGIHFARTHPS